MEEDLIQFLRNHDQTTNNCDGFYYDELRVKVNEYIDKRIDEKLKNYALKNHKHPAPTHLQRF